MSCWNRGSEPFELHPLDRVAKRVIVPVMEAACRVVSEFETSRCGEGGFGSSGKR